MEICNTHFLGTCQSVEEIAKTYTNSEFMGICYKFLKYKILLSKN